MNKENSKHGFSLIELPVVILIIVILVLLLLPSFVKARAKTVQLRCQSNLRQIGVASNLYSGEHPKGFLSETSTDNSDDLSWIFPS